MSKLLEPHLLFEWARDLGKIYSFFDCHVHPFDVLTGDIAYQSNDRFTMLFSKGNPAYHPPVVEEENERNTNSFSQPNSARALLLASRFKYLHTGPRVIIDHLNATGLSGALLLPVARTPGKAEELLQASKEMFEAERRLYFACAFPVGIPAGKLDSFFRAARENYQICAIKIHPNLAGIDPSTSEGHDLMEATLEAAGALSLPIIIHAGRTSALRPSDSAEYGTLSHLEEIHWSISAAPVIFAHAGCYELTEEDANVALSKLEVLFDKHSNLMADLSNLAPFAVRMVLKRVEPNRLLFGSDALYVQIWKAWLGFLHALQDVSSSPDNDLIRIASLNPGDYLNMQSLRRLA